MSIEKGLIKGIEPLVNARLKLPATLSYKDKTVCTQISNQPVEVDGPSFVGDIYNRIVENAQYGLARTARTGKPPSDQNWRWKPLITLTEGKSGKGHIGSEVPLERLIAILSKLAVFGLNGNWTNQMPVGSGLTEDQDGGRRIDLVHRCENGTYYLIELKTSGPRGSDTPLHAAVELLIYGLVYVFSRVHRKELNYDGSPELEILGEKARIVSLRVIAPQDFYKYSVNGKLEKYHLGWFEGLLNNGLHGLLRRPDVSLTSKLKMSFAFEEIEQNFVLPASDHGFLMRFEPKQVEWDAKVD